MNKKLDEKLVKDFPLLYRARHADPRRTCMVWGFPGDGWEPLIRNLSIGLEKIIKDFSETDEDLVCDCGCGLLDHNFDLNDKCTKVFSVPYRIGKPFRSKLMPRNQILAFFSKWKCRCVWRFQDGVNFVFNLVHKYFNISKHISCECRRFERNLPCAVQVKEKFGTLRFYMTSYLPGMDELIDAAEEQSSVTCEVCGQPGSLDPDYGWHLTLCDKHKHERREGKDLFGRWGSR